MCHFGLTDSFYCFGTLEPENGLPLLVIAIEHVNVGRLTVNDFAWIVDYTAQSGGNARAAYRVFEERRSQGKRRAWDAILER